LLQRTAGGFTVEMWNYDAQAMQYQPPKSGPPDTVRVRDMVYVVRSDSVVRDVVYINTTVKETKYLPEGAVTQGPADTGSDDPPSTTAPESPGKRNRP
jgi:hypothetical protein